MRTRERSIVDPWKNHERKFLDSYGVKSARALDEETRIALEQFGQVPAKAIPRVGGPVPDQTVYDALAVLEKSGQIVNATDLAPAALPGAYYGNNGILFSGAAPTVAIGGSTIVGTGSPSISLSDANDNTGRIVLVTGTGPSAAGVFATITFVRPKANGDYGVVIYPADGDACDRPAFSDFGGRTTTQFTVANRTAFGAGTSYHYQYFVIGAESL